MFVWVFFGYFVSSSRLGLRLFFGIFSFFIFSLVSVLGSIFNFISSRWLCGFGGVGFVRLWLEVLRGGFRSRGSLE